MIGSVHHNLLTAQCLALSKLSQRFFEDFNGLFDLVVMPFGCTCRLENRLPLDCG